MMAVEAFAALMRVLAATFNIELTPAAVEGYKLALGDLTEPELRHALARAVRECKFMPRPAELLAFVESLHLARARQLSMQTLAAKREEESRIADARPSAEQLAEIRASRLLSEVKP